MKSQGARMLILGLIVTVTTMMICLKISQNTKLYQIVVKPTKYQSAVQMETPDENGYIRSLVIVTGLSKNHYEEGGHMLQSVHHFLPDNKIIVYDLGLLKSQVDSLKEEKNVEVRVHNFSAYPRFRDQPYKGLGCYSFKPQILYEVMKEYSVVAWLDASIRLLKPIHACVEHLDVEPLTVCNPHLHNYRIVQFTRDAMLDYFNTAREKWNKVIGYQSGCIFFRMTPKLRPILDAWYECSLHRECMCGGDLKPQTSDSKCNGSSINGAGTNSTEYVNCHRYDQSALSLIVGNELGIEKVDSLVHRECTNSNHIERHFIPKIKSN